MARTYYGKHYPGQFIPLDAAGWSRGRDDEDLILRAEREADEERARRNSECSLMERFTRRVYKAIETEYVRYPDRREMLGPKLQYWARRLRHYMGRDWEATV